LFVSQNGLDKPAPGNEGSTYPNQLQRIPYTQQNYSSLTKPWDRRELEKFHTSKKNFMRNISRCTQHRNSSLGDALMGWLCSRQRSDTKVTFATHCACEIPLLRLAHIPLLPLQPLHHHPSCPSPNPLEPMAAFGMQFQVCMSHGIQNPRSTRVGRYLFILELVVNDRIGFI
jgi:hypothetical protein